MKTLMLLLTAFILSGAAPKEENSNVLYQEISESGKSFMYDEPDGLRWYTEKEGQTIRNCRFTLAKNISAVQKVGDDFLLYKNGKKVFKLTGFCQLHKVK